MASSSSKYQPLYQSDKASSHDSDHEEARNGALFMLYQSRRQKYIIALVFLVLSNVTCGGFLLMAWTHTPQTNAVDCVRPQLTYSPATSVIRYEKKRLWRDIDGPNPFTGKPRPEFDQAWRDIIAPITIKVSRNELARFSEGDTTIAYKDGSGYIAEMGVYHELHCIKRVRRYLHLDHYYPNMTDSDRIREDAHIDHCLEYWRQSVMCRGDTTLGTFFWRDGIPTSRVYTDNECVDWYALDHWARQRMVNTADYSQFVKDD